MKYATIVKISNCKLQVTFTNKFLCEMEVEITRGRLTSRRASNYELVIILLCLYYELVIILHCEFYF